MTQQIETATIVGTIVNPGNAKITVTGARISGSPKVISVAVTGGQTASDVALASRIALAFDVDVSLNYLVSGTGADIVLTERVSNTNDSTLNIASANDTCTGLTSVPTSTNTQAGAGSVVTGVLLTKIMQRAWRELGHLTDIVATGGSAITLVDSNTKYTSDNALMSGTLVVIHDAGGVGAAPEGEFSRISGFSASTKTFTMDALSAAISVGDNIGLARQTIPLHQMIESVNDGLTGLGWIDSIDTSISTSVGQTEYSLPIGLKTGDVRDILLQTVTGNSADHGYVSIKSEARVEQATPGSVGILYVPQEFTGRALKIIYNGYHPRLTVFNSTVAEVIPEELAVAAAIDKALTWLVSKNGDSALGTFRIQRWNDAKSTLASTKTEHPKVQSRKGVRWFNLNGGPDNQ